MPSEPRLHARGGSNDRRVDDPAMVPPGFNIRHVNVTDHRVSRAISNIEEIDEVEHLLVVVGKCIRITLTFDPYRTEMGPVNRFVGKRYVLKFLVRSGSVR